ncbi:MAG TPA: trehalose-phosphatase [Thermoanaerobaculia bacterium]|nr:trehalose-phosphatase [Thermoanaerobaculia bacterium]
MKRSGNARRRPSSAPAAVTGWAYFFDIDGTLVDIAGSPDSIRLDRALLCLLERLSHAAGGAMALISGRSIEDIDRLFIGSHAGSLLPVAGQHGIERRDASGRISYHEFPAERLAMPRDRLADAVARHRGLLLEDKGLSLALHYRRVPKLASYAHRLVRSLLAELGDDYCMQSGKRVVEIRPTGRHKGGAVREFMHEMPFRGRTPVFIGDDATDEDAFAVVNRLKGHSIKVGAGRTVAHWRLPDVRAVRTWLRKALPVPDSDRRSEAELAL